MACQAVSNKCKEQEAPLAKLRPRARIVRTIGDQLISGPEAALIELVKNAYDADSPNVRITIIPPSPGEHWHDHGKVIVEDLGHGMTADDLVTKWFEPATTDKLDRPSSPKGRTMLGAKGVGRFAAARLGDKLFLETTSRQRGLLPKTASLLIDWSDFTRARYLDEIDVPIATKPSKPEAKTGVRLEITRLRDKWTKARLEDLIRELRRLVSPQGARESGFRIFLDLSGFALETHGFDGQALVAGVVGSISSDAAEETDRDPTELHPFGLSDVFHYRIEGHFDTAGAFKGHFINKRGDGQPRSVDIPAREVGDDEQPCGPLHIRLNIYDREGDSLVELFQALGLGAVGRLDARRMLDENIGVGIYRQGFRIRPYGDPESDWLELERMRVQDPSRKLGLNQVLGIVEIEDERVSSLVERSSREGLEHNGAFGRLKTLLANLMVYVESLRFEFREVTGLARRQEGDTGLIRRQADLSATSRAVAKLPVKYRDSVEKALKQESQALRNTIDELEAYQHKLAAQSSLGLVVSQVLHDGRRFLGDITTRSKGLADGAPRLFEESPFGEHFRTTFGKNARSIHESVGHLTRLFKALDPIAGRKRGRPKILQPIYVLDSCLALFNDRIAALGVEVTKDLAADLPSVTLYEGDLMGAMLNIIDNALHWLSSSPNRPRRLLISSAVSSKWVRLRFSNNGPHINTEFQKNLFKPGFTLKPEGSGLGLAIAREAMRASKGNVIYDEEEEMTTFVIEIPKN